MGKLKIIHATVYRPNHNHDSYETITDATLTVEDGIIATIASAGSNSSVILEEEGDFDSIIDANHSLLIPGMNDAHIHLGMLGESHYFVDLGNCFSIQEILDLVSTHDKKHSYLKWIVGINWDQSKLGRYPNRNDLDGLNIEKPIFLWRACFHIGVTNTLGLIAARIISSRESEQLVACTIAGGVIDIDDTTGLPTGVLRERATELIMAVINKGKTLEEKRKFILEGLNQCAASGLTSVHTNDDSSIAVYRQLQQEGLLPIRVFLTPNYEDFEVPTSDGGLLVRSTSDINSPSVLSPHRPVGLTKSLDKSNKPDLSGQDSRLIIERVKIFSDGSLGAETAALRDFSNSKATDHLKGDNGSEYKGVLIHSQSSLLNMITTSSQLGYRLEIHAIGDKAAETVLDALIDCYSQSLPEGMKEYWRPILTHCQILGPDLLEKMRTIGAIANIQPSFVPTDMRWIGNSGLSAEQVRYSYCWKTLLTEGIHVAGGSDAPIEAPSPFIGIHDAIFRSNRKRLQDRPHSAETAEKAEVFRRDEQLSLAEALSLYTTGAAYAANCEHILGTIEEGFAADLLFVDPAILNVRSDSSPVLADVLHDLVPDLVLVGGQVVSRSKRVEDSKSRPATSMKGIPVILKSPITFSGEGLPIPPVSSRALTLGDGSFIPGKGGRFSKSSFSCACSLLGKRCSGAAIR